MSDLYTNDDVPYPQEEISELRRELIGSSAHNPFAGHNSSPRQAMFTKHLGQTLTISGAEPREIQTGTERELAKYTHKTKFDNNSYIVKVIDKFPFKMGRDRIRNSPTRVIIFENSDDPNLEFDVLYDSDFFKMHNFFGFRYVKNEKVQHKISEGSRIGAGTVIADSPNVLPTGDYQNGINANVIMCSHPMVTEDGVGISESFAKRLTTKVYETRKFNFGYGIMPLNLYGDDETYKIMPDIGDKVREDGILCSLREYIPELAPCDMSISALQQVTQYDKSQYVEPNATVVDITVIKGQKKSGDLFTYQEDQVDKYHKAHMEFYETLNKVYFDAKRSRGGRLAVSHELQRLLVEAYAFTYGDRKLQEKRQNLPPWSVEITVEYDIPADLGFKNTDTHGGKSVTVDVIPDENMPYDDFGNVVDIIVDDVSVIKRLIKGKPLEHYILASWRDTTTRLRETYNEHVKNKTLNTKAYEEMFKYLLGIYKISAPPFYHDIQRIRPNIVNHVESVVARGIHQKVLPDNPVRYLDVVELLEKYYPPCLSTLKYIDDAGNLKETKDSILIGRIYYILLEKIGNDPSAVTSAKLQHYGLPSKPSVMNRYDAAHKRTPVRFGESEMRLFSAFAGGVETAELIDRTTNIPVHKNILKRLLEADEPTNIDNLVDRKLYPVGGGHIQKIVRHEFESMGVRYTRAKNKD